MNESGPDLQPSPHTMQVQGLFVRHQSSVKTFILSLRPDFATADDILQETFLTVTRKAESFQHGSNFIAWVFAIARFKVMEAGRRHPRETDLADDVLDVLAAEAPPADFFDTRLTALLNCLDRLAPRAREIVRLRYQEEHGPGEIAVRLNWKAAAVNVALARARQRLRNCVQAQAREQA